MRIVRSLDLSASPILLCLVIAVVFVPYAAAYEAPSRLNEVAHIYSLGVGEVRCPSRAEWDEDWASSFAWAYTNLRENYSVLGPVVCTGALGVGSAEVPAWQQALGALVLTTRPSTFATGASGGTRGRWSAKHLRTSGTPRND